MKLAFPLLSCVLANNRIARDSESDLQAFCDTYVSPTSEMTDEQVAEIRAQFAECLTLWGGVYKSFGGECFICPCWCEARPFEETCNGETRGEFNKGIFIPYGDAAGDNKLTTQELGVHATHIVDHDFLFYAKAYREFHISSHGFIHLRNAQTTNQIEMQDRYNDYQEFGPFQNMIAPFWSDFNMAYDGILWYRAQYTNLEQLNEIVKAGTNHGLGGSDYNAVAALIVTWDTMVVTSTAEGEVNDRRNTFQTVLTQDAAGNSYVIFHYGDIEQDAGSWTDADDCHGEGGWNSWVGLTDEFGNMYQLPISHTDDMNEIDKGSNVNVRGRYMLRVDQAEIVAPPVNTQAPPVATTIAPTTLAPLLIDIDNQVKGIKEYITATNEDWLVIQNHGCHCSKLGNPQQTSSITTVDGLDTICRRWLAARMCCHKTGGLCDGPNDATYNYAIQPTCSAGAVCQNHVCDIDSHFYGEMINWIGENGFTEQNNAVCVTPQGNGNPNGTGNFRDSCCGVSAAALVTFSSEDQECLDGQVHDLLIN